MSIYHSNLLGLKLTIQVYVCMHACVCAFIHTHTILDCLLIIFVPMSAELLLLHCRAAMKPEAIKLSIAITLLHPQLPTPTVHVSGECVCVKCLTCLCYSPSVTSLPCSTKANYL